MGIDLEGYEILKAGERLLEGDLYLSTSGKLEPVPCAGMVIQEGVKALFVRKVE